MCCYNLLVYYIFILVTYTALDVYCLYTGHVLSVHWMCTACTLDVYCLYTGHVLHVHWTLLDVHSVCHAVGQHGQQICLWHTVISCQDKLYSCCVSRDLTFLPLFVVLSRPTELYRNARLASASCLTKSS